MYFLIVACVTIYFELNNIRSGFSSHLIVASFTTYLLLITLPSLAIKTEIIYVVREIILTTRILEWSE